MTRTNLSETNWAPTRASTAVALLGTAGGVVGLTTAVGVETGASVAAAGAACFAAALWLLTWDRWRAPAALAASLLLVPAGAGVTAGLGYELLAAFAAAFPPTNPVRVVADVLRTVGVVAVLGGSTLAAFGAAASVRSVATGRTVGRALGLAVRVALLPVGLFAALAGRALATNFGFASFGGELAGDALSGALDWLLAPAPGRLQLLGFWAVFAAASLAARRALGALPVQELAGEAAVGEVRVAGAADALEEALRWLAVYGVLGLPVAFLVEFGVPTATLREAVPGSVYGPLATVTASEGLRHLLARTAVVGGALAAAAELVRRSSRGSLRAALVGYAPFLAGAAVVAGVGAFHRPVLGGLVEFVAGRLNAPLSGEFRRLAGQVVEFYGPETVVLGLTAGVTVLAAVGILLLYLSFLFGSVSDGVAGPSLAGGGLFVAAAFAGTLDVPLWLVLAGLMAALAVWDAGEFAATLGAEVGRRARTGRVELLHVLASLSVGGAGALAAGWLAGALPAETAPGAQLGGVSVALLGAVGGALLLVMALR